MNTKEFIHIRLEASADAVRAWLESMAAAAQRIGGHTFSVASLEIARDMPAAAHQISTPEVSAAMPSDRPLDTDAKPPARRRYGIFDGSGVLILRADLRCPDAGTTVLELRRDDAFPLMAEELMRRLEERFPGASGEVLAEKPRVRSGAPPLACNVWLEEQLRKLPNHARYHHLYNAWLAHYVALRGYEPLDPRRSFRAAVRGCYKRMNAGTGAQSGSADIA